MSSQDNAVESPKKESQSSENAKPQQVEGATNAPAVYSRTTQGADTTVAQPVAENDEAAEGEELEADEGYADSAFGTDNSDSTSISSSIYQGYVENGRRYQTKREGEYWGPSDEKQMQSQQKAHVLHYILDSNQKNPSFHAPIPETAQNILDIGTGTGDWCRDVADRFPTAFVQGVDLSPPPDVWVPPNCKFEVDDILKTWDFKQNGSWDLIHLRYMYGSFTDEQWRLVYKQAYKNLAPGGWIEQIEVNIAYLSDDGSLPADSLLARSGPMFRHLCAKSGKRIDTEETFGDRIEAAGFTNIHEKLYKVPVGDWVKSPLLKEAGRFHKAQLMEGWEGYSMFLLTHYGDPTPWSPEEVQVYVAKIKQEMNDHSIHSYHRFRRVWAQKPYDKAEKVESKVEVEKLA